jgi:glycosyltransferase involved in cell wall biosynthesis
VAGIDGDANPYQTLMVEGLARSGRVVPLRGASGKHLAALRSVLLHRPRYLHYDWNYAYFIRRWRPLTWISAALFLLEVAVVRWMFRCDVVWTLHNIESHDRRQPLAERLVQRIFARMCRWVRVMYPSSVARAVEYLGIPAERIRVVPMGSYAVRYPDEVGRDEARRALGIGDGAFVVLHMGVMRANKGIDVLIDAVRENPAPELRLLVVGPSKPPEYGDALAAAADDPRVSVRVAFVPDERMQDYLNAADVVALPFAQIENSSSVVLAMAFGKPILSPALGVLPEQLAQQAELLYAPGGLEDALERARTMAPERLAALGEANRAVISACRWEDFAALFAPDE